MNILATLLFLCLNVNAQPSIRLIEGAFIFKFTHFIDKNLVKESINICIFKDKEIYKNLSNSINGKVVGDKIVKISSVNLDDIKSCNILFLGKQLSDKQQDKVLKQIKNVKVFTISRDNYNIPTTVINLKLKNKSLIFDANNTLIKKYHITLSSKVLRLADKVY